MRKNRKVSKRRSVVGMHVMHLGAIMMMGAVMVVLNILASSSCGQLMKSIGEKDRLIQARQSELERTIVTWEEMTKRENLERELRLRGISMVVAKPSQTIKIDGRGEYKTESMRTVASIKSRFDPTATALASTRYRRTR